MSKISMLNGFIACEELKSNENSSEFIVPDSDKSYKELLVSISSDETVVPVGSIITVLRNSGTPIKIKNKDHLVVNIKEIILIQED